MSLTMKAYLSFYDCWKDFSASVSEILTWEKIVEDNR